MSSISFKNNGVKTYLKNKTHLKELLHFVFENEGVEFRRVCFIFCTDQGVLELNRKFLKHDTLTDILTFTLSKKNEAVISEIYISVERIKENAEEFSVSFSKELYRVMIHGILHLCGFLDFTPTQKRKMREKEDFYLKRVRFT